MGGGGECCAGHPPRAPGSSGRMRASFACFSPANNGRQSSSRLLFPCFYSIFPGKTIAVAAGGPPLSDDMTFRKTNPFSRGSGRQTAVGLETSGGDQHTQHTPANMRARECAMLLIPKTCHSPDNRGINRAETKWPNHGFCIHLHYLLLMG